MPNYVQLNHGLQRAQGFAGTLLNYGINQQRTDIARDNQQLQQQKWDETQRQQRYSEIGSALKLGEQSVARGEYATLQESVYDNPGLMTQLTHELISPEQVAKVSNGGKIVNSKYNSETGKVHYDIQAEDGTVTESPFGISGDRLYNETRNRFAHQGYGQLDNLEYSLRQQGDTAGADQVAQQKQELLAQAEANGMDPAAITAPPTPLADTTRIIKEQEEEDRARAAQQQTIDDKRARLDQMPGGDTLSLLTKPAELERIEEEEEEEEVRDDEGATEKTKNKSLKTVLSEVSDEVTEFVKGGVDSALDAMPDSAYGVGESIRNTVGEEVDEFQEKGAVDYANDNLPGWMPQKHAAGVVSKGLDVAGDVVDGLVGNPREGEAPTADTVPLDSVTSGQATISGSTRQVAYGNGPKQQAPVVRNASLLETQMNRPLGKNPDAWAKRGAMYIASMAALRGGKPTDFDAKVGANIASTGDPLGLARATLGVQMMRARALYASANARKGSTTQKTRAAAFDRYQDYANTRAEGRFEKGKNNSYRALEGINVNSPAEYLAFHNKAVAENPDMLKAAGIPTVADQYGRLVPDYENMSEIDFERMFLGTEYMMRLHGRKVGGIPFVDWFAQKNDVWGNMGKTILPVQQRLSTELEGVSYEDLKAMAAAQGQTVDQFLFSAAEEIHSQDDELLEESR